MAVYIGMSKGMAYEFGLRWEAYPNGNSGVRDADFRALVDAGLAEYRTRGNPHVVATGTITGTPAECREALHHACKGADNV